MAVSETIYALATPYGRGGIAVVRVSGPSAALSLQALSGATTPRARQAVLRTLTDPVSRETIDRPLVLFFPGPGSYTGEDTVEYHLHGGVAVVQAVLAALSAQPDHRLAQPGEFTRRAFENGKMDLTAAEAVADLIDAETEVQRQQALAQMDGALAGLYEEWRARLTRILAYVEAGIDFADEEVPADTIAPILPDFKKLVAEIAAHLADSRRGERLRNGIKVVLIGAPNAGKSSLLNALAARDVAIVSPLAGTTRDVIEVPLNLAGYPVILTDTAGLRPDQIGQDGHEGIESEGIRRALAQAQNADLKLLVFDSAVPQADPHTQALVDERALIVYNKSDSIAVANPPPDAVLVSAKTGAGLDILLGVLVERVKALLGARTQPPPTRARHREELSRCQDALDRALGMAEDPDMDIELLAEDVRLAIRHLGHITGRVDVEDLLDVIFRDFCIGK